MSALSGRTAWVTGASRGIGRAVARRTARSGAPAAVHCAWGAQEARETVELIGKDGGRAFAVQAEFGVPDILVNGAGIAGAFVDATGGTLRG
ncbi:SDR family NAD(P)-dependent oxidoreductase [Kitasatospora sp. NPDC089509]|uniref:SDR family NAD(P)-dependent oxidoreductase n=1 Tax=Kitasatospora sp. NPDC089509 TaxID=3364079 RepID=UPI0038062033